MRRFGAGVLAVALLVSGVAIGAAAANASAVGTVRCRLHDERIDEASGIARGIRSPDVFYVQNDSGDTNRFFALDARTCRTVATITVPGARNVDWEDIAVAPDADGKPSVWLADIGDNDEDRDEVDVYRVPEPRIPGGDTDHRLRTDAAQVWRLRYPDGAVNAESFAVTPAGVGYVVTKSLIGQSAVYRLPAAPDADRVQNWSKVGSITFAPDLSSGNNIGAIRSVLATSAAFSADGSMLVVRTYTTAYAWSVAGGNVGAALRHPPTRIALPDEIQGEGIAVDGRRVLLDSEGIDGPIYSIALPPLVAAPTESLTGSTPSTTSASSTTSGAASSPSSGSSTSKSGGGSSGGGWVTGIIIGVLLVAGSIGWWVLQLRGGRSGDRAGR